jgi:hypothetical protein
VPGKNVQEQQHRSLPDKDAQEQRFISFCRTRTRKNSGAVVPGDDAQERQHRFVPSKNAQVQRHHLCWARTRKKSDAVSCRAWA